jgi:hypothetical protein
MEKVVGKPVVKKSGTGQLTELKKKTDEKE